MVRADQPNLPAELLAYFSSREDGTVLDRAIGIHDGSIVSSRTRICEAAGVDYGNVVFQRIVYSPGASYELLAEVDERSTTAHTSEVVADVLFTKVPGVGLFLPVADCTATILYDPRRKYLAMLHLGRHSTMTDLIAKTVRHFEMNGSNPADLSVWMSPSAQKQSYRLDYFDHATDKAWQGFFEKKDDGYYLDMQGYNRMRFITAGIPEARITVSSIDTVTNDNYFSHSAGDVNGRMAAVAMMR